MPIEAILTDWGNVMVPFSAQRQVNDLVRHVPHRSPEELQALIWSGPGLEWLYAFERGEITSQDYAQQLREYLGMLEVEDAEFWRIHIESNLAFDRGVIDLWKEVKMRQPHLRLIAITNVDVLRHDYILRECGLPFDGVAASFKVGHMKPHVVMYDTAVALAGCKPEACFYVDDIPELVVVAEHLGIRSHHFRGLEPLKQELRSHGLLP